ncbi:MAG TPA: hypothetical protein VFQ58_03465 [Flavisolibacter sp.]|jgi:hypothetical protein|nr:hypothetical protein [Flavisolibacter sp.]
MEYIYLGDRNTKPSLIKIKCCAVLKNGKCIRGKNGSMLVEMENSTKIVVIARLLRKIKI